MIKFFLICAVGLSALAGPSLAAPVTYNITTVADPNSYTAAASAGNPAINNMGDVVFSSFTSDPLQGGLRTLNLWENGVASEIFAIRSIGAPLRYSINNNGEIAFSTSAFGPPGTGIVSTLYKATNGAISPIADSSGPIRIFSGIFHDINDNGDVAFRAGLDVDPSTGRAEEIVGIASGGSISEIARTGVGDLIFLTPALNNSGDILTARLLEDNSTTAPVLYTNGTQIPFLRDTAVDQYFSLNLNDGGQVAFGASLFDGSQQILYGQGSSASVIFDTQGAFAGFGFTSLNNNGDLAFVATLDSGVQSLFYWSSGMLSTVISTGDTLNGLVISFLFFGVQGLNDLGQLTFGARFADGSEGIFFASPNGVNEVPIPGAIALFATGLAGLALRRRKKGRSSLRLNGAGRPLPQCGAPSLTSASPSVPR